MFDTGDDAREFSYLVEQLLSCSIGLNGELQFSIHCGDSYTNLWETGNHLLLGGDFSCTINITTF